MKNECMLIAPLEMTGWAGTVPNVLGLPLSPAAAAGAGVATGALAAD